MSLGWYRDYAEMTDQQLCALLKVPPGAADRSQLIRMVIARNAVRHFVFGAFCLAAAWTLGWIIHAISK